MPDFDPGPVQEPAAVPGTPLTRLWRSRPIKGPSAPLAHDSVNVYLGGSDRRVVSVDLASGRTRWARRVQGPLVGGVLLAGQVVYAASERPGKLYALQAASGNELWSISAGGVEAPLALVDERLIVLNREHRIMAVNPTSGHVLWRRALPSQQIAPVALDEKNVLVTSYDSLYRVRAADGVVTLRVRAPGTLVAPWVRMGDRLIAGTGDSLVIAIEPDSLRLDWQVRLDGPLLTPPAVVGDTLYCVTQLGSLYRVAGGAEPEVTRLGAERWAATGAPAVVGGWILVGGADGALRAFRQDDGTEAWSTLLGRPLELAPLPIGGGEFIALGGRGDLHRMKL